MLVSSATVEEVEADDTVEGKFLWRRVDKVAVKGRSKPELVFQPLGLAETVSEEDTRWAKDYEAALDAYLERRFADSLEILSKLAAARPNDLSVDRLAKSCRAYSENPPPADWDGVSRFTSKG